MSKLGSKTSIAATIALCSIAFGAACSSTDEPSTHDHGSSSASAEPVVVLPVRINGGSVQPTNQRVEAKVGQPISVQVDSDTDEELHVHSEPEHTFEITPGAGQKFDFTVDVPGQVAVELHHSDTTVATLLVRK